MSRKKNIKKRRPPMGADELDDVLQAQLEYLARKARGATGSDILIMISHLEEDGKLQTAISSRGGHGPDGQLSEAVRAMVTVAATTVRSVTGGKVELVLKMNGEEFDPTEGAEAVMLRREYGD